MAVYPNPAHDKVTVSISVNEVTDLTMQFTDVSGRVVLSQTEAGTAGLNIYHLDLAHLSKGVYLMEVKSADESWKTRVVVE